ncbi:hypothetical protein JXM67_01040 [candidate division WOR-3 bacterium]|nr:hypothetical protein [candidate division WOR-3 bacterium]
MVGVIELNKVDIILFSYYGRKKELGMALSREDIERIELVIFHCRMLEYWFDQKSNPVLEMAGFEDPIARFYHNFAGLHLLATLLLVDRRQRPMGGFFYNVLEPIRLGDLLEPIRNIIDSPVGETTFGDFIRHNRNKLTVHGDLTFDSLPQESKDIPFDKDAVETIYDLFEELDVEVTNLKLKLEEILKSGSSEK